jgi:predicted AlkP superfamily phosphohydrolase/phosphomutase
VPRTARTLFLGLDACDPELVRRYAAEGDMPHLARLLTTAARGRYDNEPGYFVGSVWPTITTGTPVEQHGWFTGTRFRPEYYDYVPHDLAEKTVWERVHEAGLRVAVLDAPHVRAVEGLNGVQVCEWGCHDRIYGTHSWPPDLIGELNAAHGAHPVGTADAFPQDPRHSPCDHVHRAGAQRTEGEAAALFDDLLLGVERKTKASVDLLDRGGWDLFFCIMGEAHCAGHQFWHEPARVREVYRRLDHAVGAHLERLGPDDTAYVLLSHGMQAHDDGTHLLPEILHRLDRAYPHRQGKRDRAVSAIPPAAVRLAGRAVRAVRRGPTTPGDVELPPLWDRHFMPIDNNTASGAVRLNLEGRERAGKVPAADKDAALAWLERRLRELVNLDTGQRVVTGVRRSGLVDLLVEWNRERPVQRVWSPLIGLVDRPYTGVRTGDHSRGGLLLAQGRGLVPGETAMTPLDIVPVLAASIGVPTPDLSGVARPSLVPGPPRPPVGLGGHRVLQQAGFRAAKARAARRSGMRRDLDGLLEAHHETRLATERLEAAAAAGALAAEILATTTWVKSIEQRAVTLVSAVMATRNRRDLVMRAIASVQRQSYPAIEILVVDDASDDGTWNHLSSFEDPRVRCFREPRQVGTGGARNRALSEASGEIVVYLDDDNTMDPDWVKSVVWAFEQHPNRDVLYGARVVDDVERHHGGPPGGLPWLQLLAWDRAAMQQANRVDMNVLAHRRSEARFDEANSMAGDWDLVLQLTQHTEPLRLPVIAACYSTDAPGRMSTDVVEMADAAERVRRKWQSE